MSNLNKLKTAYENRDAEAVEVALYEEIPHIEETVSVLAALLDSDWHHKHEDIVRELQSLKNPTSIDVLRKTAERKFEYLEYDNSEALARKCTWALADIGTARAKAALEELSLSFDKTVADCAVERLVHWESESARKGA